ncbi:TPA: DUF2972 domain-containing protein, partial [Campylobacter jejuni]|nr:DUF2972 domain-containing protein [Campylobacter jejuni]
ADKTWYKGGYFYLYRDIIQAKRDYDIVKNLHIDVKKLKNKEKFLKNYNLIKEILNLHKNYKPILNNIFHNFDFFIRHFNVIKPWLLSDDFYYKYKKENHPYPSLLDPKKLNDENEKINYKNIPAELAWEMNLPLPDNYKLVWLIHPATASIAIEFFLRLIEIKFFLNPWIPAKKNYSGNYLFLRKSFGIIVLFSNYDGENIKFLYLIQGCKTIFTCTRDPISLIRHFLNHINRHETYKNITLAMKKFNLSHRFNFPSIVVVCSSKENPEVESIRKLLEYNTNLSIHFKKFYFTTQKRLNILKKYNKIENIECLEMADINKENAFNTFTRLAKKYGFTPPNDPIPFQGRVNNSNGDLIYLPVTLYAHPYDLTHPKAEDDTSFSLEGGVSIIITTHQIHPKKEGFVDITKEIFDNKKLMFDNIVLLVKSNEYEILKNNQELFLASKKYLNDYMDALEKHEQKIKDNLITEEQILDYLKDKKDLRIKLKSILDEDLTYVRENHPEYLQKWKYYQEFERLCEND